MASDAASNEAFRNEFRAAVPAGYSGYAHGAKIAGFGLVVIALCIAFMTAPVRWWEIATALPVLALWNVLEWWGHLRLHRPGKSALSRALYKRHALTHHRFFTHECPTLRDSRDLKIVFFPAFALPVLTTMAIVPAVVIALLVSVNAALVAMIAWVASYLVFELFHLGAHLPEGQWFARLPLVTTMRRHHQRHHDPRIMMAKNMNFTLPFADWAAGTTERGSRANGP